ncbi:hypothetical protein ACFQ3J_11295 [Paenibacillus provencensis]|uniref:Uncharacterized protein n=1 Tax=Paenibacillus provencensis TaxID=441151 RepID=A0ABW3Q3I9_9BACL|nr:hypothetical protein [Paenibacillus sp. MER 78]MCM3127230.1 hypothetical protein [Paenibacillus sp. MER 78]
MYQEVNERLALLKEKGRLLSKWNSRLDHLGELEQQKEELVAVRKERLAAEQKDVDTLTRTSIASVFYSIMGKKEQKLEKEEAELIESKGLYDEAVRALNDIREQMKGAREEIAALSEWQNWERQYDQLMNEKQDTLLDSSPFILTSLEHEAKLKGQIKEVGEAERAGHKVLDSLHEAEEALRSAGNWGTYDMLGGGAISTYIKHSRVDEAESHVHAAQYHLREFQEELRDVDLSIQGHLKIDGMLSFADYFLDGFFTDWLVQNKINEGKEEVGRGVTEVNRVLSSLSSTKDSLMLELDKLQQERRSFVEEAE